jgi:hypothetical protein
VKRREISSRKNARDEAEGSRSFGMTVGGSARAAPTGVGVNSRPLRGVNQGAQGRIDGLLLRKILNRVPLRGSCNPKREMIESFRPSQCDSDLTKTL